MTNAIEVRDLVKRYRKSEKNAVDGVSFSVAEGEFFAFLGPNGAGKTTTISILTTLLTKSGGEVRVAGFDIDENANEVRKRIGVIFQVPSLDKNLTAEENIRLHAALYGLFPFRPLYALMPRAYKNRVTELAELVGVQDALFRPIHTYSGGMKRKLEIIRSLMHNPRVLFLDEPTTGLDPVSRKSVWEHLRAVRKSEKTTVFLTTHYLDEAEEADRICIMDKGKIIALGSPEEVGKSIIDPYLLLDAKDRSALLRELASAGVDMTDGPHIRVPITGARSAQEIIRAIHTPLSFLRIHQPTLEEAYIEIITKSSESAEILLTESKRL